MKLALQGEDNSGRKVALINPQAKAFPVGLLHGGEEGFVFFLQTDSQGKLVFKNVPEGSWRIRVLPLEYGGAAQESEFFQVSEEQEIEVKMSLR